MALAGGSADGSDASLEVILLSQVVRPPLPAVVVTTAEEHEPTVSLASEFAALWVEQRSVAEKMDSTGGHRSTFSILSRAVSDV